MALSLAASRVSVVIATRNRRASLLRTLAKLQMLPERPPIIVVDNASSDGTQEAIRSRHPRVRLLPLWSNQGALARNAGVREATTRYVAFSDDDSWWAAGSLARAAELFDRYPRLALIAATVLVGDENVRDPTCAEMAASPLESEIELPGRPILGFVGCGALVRRSAFLDVGGFNASLGFVAEERLLAVDLATAGWGLAYVPVVVAHHYPSPARDETARRRLLARNTLWFAWLRRPLPSALHTTARLTRLALFDRAVCSGLFEGLRGLPRRLAERRSVPKSLEEEIRLTDPRTFS